MPEVVEYRIVWETVKSPWFYYLNGQPNCKKEDVPNDAWIREYETVSDDNRWPEFKTIKSWADSAHKLVRNVGIEHRVVTYTEWKNIGADE